jgi:hypothetical protein
MSRKTLRDPKTGEHPIDTEKRTRGWPKSITPVANFADAETLEAQLQSEGYETARINWGGQYFEVRARKARP